ncbi:translation initiation factor IF-2 [Patescibacteria group bacterium]
MGKKKSKKKPNKTTSSSNNRPPIVTIMGHVDHGKTSLLDFIRKSHIQAKEAGGITQHIGAYQIKHQDKPITFIDTPGHAAFNKMRSRGAQATDIVILVIAATEGVKPQTVESINHIKNANVPFLIALNKMDLPAADPMTAKSELAKYEVMVEEFGGKIPTIEVSAKTGKGVDQLLDMIQLMYDLEPVGAKESDPLNSVVIESSLNKHKGPIATVLVKNGTIKVGQTMYVEKDQFKVRSLTNDQGERVKLAGPSTPVEVTGFKSTPPVGAKATEQPTEKTLTIEEEKSPTVNTDEASQYEEDLKALLEEKEIEKPPSINIIIKTDVEGTLEAIKVNLPDEVIIIDSSVGQVSDSDVLMASSTGSTIIAFNVNIPKSSKTLAINENVSIKQYSIIYKLLEDVEKIILKLLEPTIDEEELGVADILQVFEIKSDRIAGCKVVSGRIEKTDLVHLMRDEKILSDVKIKSLKQAKVDTEKIKSGNECGIVIYPQSTFQVGDKLIAYKKKEE